MQRTVDLHWHHVPPSFVDVLSSSGAPVAGTIGVAPEGGLPMYGHDAKGGGPMVELDGGFRQDFPAVLTDTGAAIAHMDRAGIDLVALSVPPPLMQYHASADVGLRSCQLLNDGLAESAAVDPERFAALATVPLQSPETAAEELRRCVRSLGMAGVQIDSNVRGRQIGDPEFHPFWREVADLNALVFIHPGPTCAFGVEDGRLRNHGLVNFVGMPIDTAAAVASLIFSGVLEEFGRMKICLAHGGGAFPYLLGRWDHGHTARTARAGTSVGKPSSYLDSIYCDSLTHSARGLGFLLDTVGEDHVVMGSDYPFNMGEPAPVDRVREAVGSQAARTKVLGETALRLLGR